jgi:hypothetical protein
MGALCDMKRIYTRIETGLNLASEDDARSLYNCNILFLQKYLIYLSM